MQRRRPNTESPFDALADWLNKQAADSRARLDPDYVPPPRKTRGAGGHHRLRFALLLAVVLIIGAWIIFGAISDPLADYLWFTNVGFGAVWSTQFAYGFGLFCLALIGSAVFLVGDLVLAWRLSDDPTDAQLAARASVRTGPEDEVDWMTAVALLPRAAIRVGLIVVALVVALLLGLSLSGAWQTVALWLHGVSYAPSGAPTPDPVFGLDLGWWLFSLPFLHLVLTLVGTVLAATLLLVGAAYGLSAVRGGDVTSRGPILHLAILGAGFLVTLAAIQWLGRYDLSYQHNGVVTGVTATDAAVRLPLAAATSISTLVAAVVLIVLAVGWRSRWVRGLALAIGGWYVLLLVGGTLLPWAYQQFIVAPNQNSAEAPYIANNIALTRQAFDLEGWHLESYTGATSIGAADLSNDQTTFNNARLWDYRPLGTTLDQLQTVRQYYDFTSVDIDRYQINGQPTQVMLSAREMALDKSQSNPTWISAHILYTHGYGLAMVPVNAVDANGLPNLIIKDLPVTEAPGVPTVAQPRIYFGERPSDWVLVDAKTPEFDYPSSTGNGNDVTTEYTGETGLPVGSPIARLFWATHLGDLNLLISDQVTAQTQLLIHRSLADRLGTLAPFLALDGDPYLVIGPDGHLVYVQDAYTTTRAVPDATSTSDTTLKTTYDYIRNSVKITIDAYDGTTHFYVADPDDPLIRAWQGVFPTMFEPLSAMPSGLVAHLRTPETMFNAQVQTYATYHVTDVASFYKSDNLWTVPSVTEGSQQVVTPEAYYVEIRLPGQAQAEFVLIQPMVPASRPNMIAWVAARNDGTARGQVTVYELPANTTIQGPTQIEARIDQDSVISAQISLWDQAGSKVIRGNLLVLPVGTSFVYLEPIYLQSTSSAFPELTKVVVATSATVGWGNTLDQALGQVISGAGTGGGSNANGGGGGSPTPIPTTGATAPPVAGLPTDVAGLVQYANDHFTAAKAAQARGDFVTYGQEMQHVADALNALDALTGGSLTASPSPTVSTGP
ncbi:MAG: UPF0182 family protein [Candidatus Limnocylindrales bacterium]